VSVNVLFDVLLNINILMSPQVPFLTEYMYQNMKHVINKESKLFSESIHFLMIPDSEEKLIDAQIQRVLADTQEIIETGRKLRDKKKISLKHPIMSLTIIDKSVDKLNALKPMVKYIEEELNVAEVLFEPHPEKYIKHEAKPNLPVLGAKLKGNKNFKGIQDKIKAMTFEEIEKAKENGTISFFEVPLNVKEDIIITDKFIDTNIKPHEAIDGSSVL
jgi:isoleucyl-tRNA synthetase